LYLPPYSPDLNPIEFIGKSVEKIISVSFVRHLGELKQRVGHAFDALSQRLSFARSRTEKIPRKNKLIVMENYAFNYNLYKCNLV
jgi:transposase